MSVTMASKRESDFLNLMVYASKVALEAELETIDMYGEEILRELRKTT